MSALATTQGRELSPAERFRDELARMGEQFAAALPSHIKPEKFQRVVTTAVLSDPAILRADRRSLMEAAIRAAQDGLLPDKREGAFVVFKDTVQWMPMVAGIIKRIQQSGEIRMITARVVYEGDHFRTWIDDTGEHVEYEPGEDQNTEVIRRVFAMATTTNGAVYVEPMSAKDIEKIRGVSRARNGGPWTTWWEEMAKKSAIRRLAKRLPLSTDMHDLMQRDNDLYDLSQMPEPRSSLQDRLRVAKQTTISAPKEGFAQIGHVEDAEVKAEDTASERDDAPPANDASEDDRASQGNGEAGETERRFDAATTDILTRYTADMLASAIGEGAEAIRLEAVKEGSTKLWAKELQSLSVDARKVSESVYKSARAIARDDADVSSAITFFAEQIGVEESALRRDA